MCCLNAVCICQITATITNTKGKMKIRIRICINSSGDIIFVTCFLQLIFKFLNEFYSNVGCPAVKQKLPPYPSKIISDTVLAEFPLVTVCGHNPRFVARQIITTHHIITSVCAVQFKGRCAYLLNIAML